MDLLATTPDGVAPPPDAVVRAPLDPEQVAAAALVESAAAHAGRFHYRLVVSISGRVRFLSHLETVDTLLGALRRSGVELAMSAGMRPKPLIKVAMPRPVATEAWSDIVEVELAEWIDPDQFALRLSETLPLGLALHRVERLEGAYASAASRVAGAMWQWAFDAEAIELDALRAAIDRFRDADEVLVERSSPGKPTRHVDVRRVVGDIQLHDPVDGTCTMRAFVRLTEHGSAKPDEVLRALGADAGRAVRPRRTIRESILLAEPGTGGLTAEPSLVGADVPDGPARPWGAC